MTTSQVSKVSSFQDIQECQYLDPASNCFILTVQELGTLNIDLQCFDLSAFADLDDAELGTIYNFPTLSQYNGAVPQLIQDGYTEVCRWAKEEGPGKYPLISTVNPNTIRGTSSPPAAQAPQSPPASPAPGVSSPNAAPSPVTQKSTQQQSTTQESPNGTMFEACRQEMGDNNGTKVEFDIELTACEARYLAEKFGSTDHMIGCYITQADGKYKLWITNQPARIDDAIDEIKRDIFEKKLPKGIDSSRAREFMAELKIVKNTFPANLQVESTSQLLEGQDSFKFWVVLMGFVNLLGAGLAVLASWRLSKKAIEASKDAAKMALEGRLGKEITIDDISIDLVDQAKKDLAPNNPKRSLNEIMGRDTEAILYLRGLDRMKNANPLLVGPSGVGKDEVIKRAAQLISKKDPRVPKRILENPEFKIRAVMPDAFQVGTKWVGTPAERVNLLRVAMEAGDNVYFPELGDFVSAGSSADGTHSALGSLAKDITTKPFSKWSGSTTPEGYNRIIESGIFGDLERRFPVIQIKQLPPEVIRGIIAKQYAPAFAQHHGVKYSGEVVDAAIRLGTQYHLREGKANVIDAINLALEDAMQLAAAESQEKGTPAVVTEEHVYKGIENRLGTVIPRDESDGRPPDDNLPPGAPASSGSPQAAPSAAPQSSGAKFTAMPANLPLITDGVPVSDASWSLMPQFAEAVVISGGDSYAPHVVAMATPEGYIMRAVTTEAMETPPPRSGGMILRAAPGSSASTWSRFGTSAAFNTVTGIGAWGLINYAIEPRIGRELEWYESMGIYAGSGIAGSAGLAYLAGSSPQWGTLIAGVPAGFAGFLPIGYSISTSESLLGMDPASPASEFIVIGGGGLLAAAGSTSTLPASVAGYFGVSTAAEAGLTTAGVGLGIGTGVVVGASLLAGVGIGYGIDEGLGELGVCNSTGSDCSFTGWISEMMAEKWSCCHGGLATHSQ